MKANACKFLGTLVIATGIVAGCQNSPMSVPVKEEGAKVAVAALPVAAPVQTPVTPKRNDAKAVLALPEVPVLCYHQIRDFKPTDSKTARDYIVPPAAFKAQMQMLADSGYHTVLPDQLYAYLTTGAPLPKKPVMITFDDTDLEQYTVAYPAMQKLGFKAVFFIMTVSLNKARYMSVEQVKELATAGNVIGSHTWDHKNIKKYESKDWAIEIDKPTRQLEAITGKPVKYFAYPFGLWDTTAIPQLKERGFQAAFQLSARRDPQDPLHTIRRIIVPGSWSPGTLHNVMRRSFSQG